jgi:predicted DNA-binding transcriptional regulator
MPTGWSNSPRRWSVAEPKWWQVAIYVVVAAAVIVAMAHLIAKVVGEGWLGYLLAGGLGFAVAHWRAPILAAVMRDIHRLQDRS